MLYRELGTTGAQVSEIILGAWQFGQVQRPVSPGPAHKSTPQRPHTRMAWLPQKGQA